MHERSTGVNMVVTTKRQAKPILRQLLKLRLKLALYLK